MTGWGALKALNWRLVAGLATLAMLIVHLAWIDPRLRAERDAAMAGFRAEKAAHEATVAGVRAATAEARRLADVEVARVRAEQDAATREIVDDYQNRLAAVRDRAATAADRLRGDPAAARTGTGGAGAAGLPGPGAATGRAGEATGEDRLPAADALIATEQALQLDALIDWTLRQAQIGPAPEEKP